MAKYMCILCGFIYDEAVGHEDIPAGTLWENVAEDWTCPDCGAMKNEFEMIEIT